LTQTAGPLDDGALFRVAANLQSDIAVRADARASEALKASLHDTLARLPVKVILRG